MNYCYYFLLLSVFVDDVGDVTFLGRGRRVLPGVTAVGVALIGKGFCEGSRDRSLMIWA